MTRRTRSLLLLLRATALLVAASPAAATRPVDRHIGRWETAPMYVPSRSATDGPLAGNGDLGVVITGARCCTAFSSGSQPCVVDGGANVSTADLSFYFGKTDFWINQPSLSADTTGEPWSHATPGFVTVSVDEPLSPAGNGATQPSTPGRFSATQELSTARVNATVGLAGGGTLTTSSFVASDRNLVVSRLRIEGSGIINGDGVATTFILSTPNTWQVPLRSGTLNGAMWLRKDACNTVKNALTLTQCSPEILMYNSIRDIKVDRATGAFRFMNGSLAQCIRSMPAVGSVHTPNAALKPEDAWLTAGPCSSATHSQEVAGGWKLASGKLTDGTNCATYKTSGNQWSVKVLSVECAGELPVGFSDIWTLESGTGSAHGRLRATDANLTGVAADGNVLYAGGACLSSVPDNVNVSVALAATVVDAAGQKVAGEFSCVAAAPPVRNSTQCSFKSKLWLHRDFFLLVSCLSQRDTDWQHEALDSALALLDGVSVVQAEQTKDRFWTQFWSESSIDLAPQWSGIEAWYFGMLYLAGISFAPGKVGTSHYGSWNIADHPQCHGQLTLDYNTEACLFGLGSANRLALMKPLIDSIGRRDLYELGLARAAQKWSPTQLPNSSHTSYISDMVAPMGQQAAGYGCISIGGSWAEQGGCPADFGPFKGIELPAAVGPFYNMAAPVDAVLRFNAGLSLTMLLDYYDFTQDETFFNVTLLPFLRGVADFYASYAQEGPNSTLHFMYTCAQENCQDRDGAGRNAMEMQANALPDLAFARMAVRKLHEYAGRGLTSHPKPSWLDLERRLIPYPLTNRSRPDGLSGFALGWTESMNCAGDNPADCAPINRSDGRGNDNYPIVYFAPIHPAGVVGLESDPLTLEHARATVFGVNAGNNWAPSNGLCLGWPSASRVMGSVNGTRVLQYFTDTINRVIPATKYTPAHKQIHHNFVAELGGGGLENIGGIEAINSMLLQSHESCIRLFPGWPRNSSAKFDGLRARGRFVVSASQSANGTISAVRVLSELGQPLSFCLPAGWVGTPVITCGGEPVIPKQTSAALRRFEVSTTAGMVCELNTGRPARNADLGTTLKTDDVVAVTTSSLLLKFLLQALPVAHTVPVVAPPMIQFEMRNRSFSQMTKNWTTNTWTRLVNPSELAILVIDPWAYHWCKTTTARGEALMPRINAGLAAGRKAGVGAVIFAPTSAVVNYLGWEQRERAVAIPRHKPHLNHRFKKADAMPAGWQPPKNRYLADNLNCMCGITADGGCTSNSGEMRMSTVIDVQPTDYIVGGWDVSELYSIIVEKGIKTVAYMGISANDCVQSKAEGMWNMQRMGIDFFLFRDTTDGETFYDDKRPYINPDNGTRLIVENMEALITPTTEAVAFAEAQGTWESSGHEGSEAVMMTPWGSYERPHILDPEQTLGVRISTPCDMVSDCTQRGWAKEGDWLELHVTTDGHPPTPAHTALHHQQQHANVVGQASGPLVITVDSSMQNESTSRRHEGVTIRAAGFSGRNTSQQLFAQSSSVVVFRPIRVVDLPKPRLCITAVPLDYRPIYYASVQRYCDGHPCDVRVATVNHTYSDVPFAHLPGNHGQGWNLTMRNMSAGTGCHPGVRGCQMQYTAGLGLWAPSFVPFNLTTLSAKGFTRWVGAVGIDTSICGGTGADWVPFATPSTTQNCADVAEFASAQVKVFVDGVMVQSSPILRIGEGLWPFDVTWAHGAHWMRIEAVRGPAAQGGKTSSGDYVSNQDAYDLVDIVLSGFL